MWTRAKDGSPEQEIQVMTADRTRGFHAWPPILRADLALRATALASCKPR